MLGKYGLMISLFMLLSSVQPLSYVWAEQVVQVSANTVLVDQQVQGSSSEPARSSHVSNARKSTPFPQKTDHANPRDDVKSKSDHSHQFHKPKVTDASKKEYDHLKRGRFYTTTVIIPSGFTSIMVNGNVYYYQQGEFYQLIAQQLLPVGAPLDAIVESIPTNRFYAKINDIGYSIYNGVYYRMTPEGLYQVVAPPFQLTDEERGTVMERDNEDSVMVNVFNSNSRAYSLVLLMKSDDGLIGPQGELYPEIPSIAQVEDMYAQ